MAHGGKRPGAGRKKGSKSDPKKALVKATNRIVAELAIAITGDITALGKDRLAELEHGARQRQPRARPSDHERAVPRQRRAAAELGQRKLARVHPSF